MKYYRCTLCGGTFEGEGQFDRHVEWCPWPPPDHPFWKKALILFVLVLLVGCGGPRNWTKADTARQVGVTALLALDCWQTQYIVDHPDRFYETNLILGNHPSSGAVYGYFITAAVISAVVAWAMSDDWRPWWQTGWIGAEIGITARNKQLGIGGN